MKDETPRKAGSGADVGAESERLFVAIALPEAVSAKLARLIENLKKGFQFTPCRPKWVDPSSIHLTLRFLGATPSDRIEALSAEIESIVGRYGPVELKIAGFGVFPSWRRPRVLWAGAADLSGHLGRLQGEIEAAAVGRGYSPSAGEFQAHLTLARLKSLKGIDAVRKVLSSHEQRGAGSFTAREVRLYRSRLGPEGARHEVVGRFALKNGQVEISG